MKAQKPLIGLSLAELTALLADEPPFRAKQLYDFLYAKHGAPSRLLSECTVLPKSLLHRLETQWRVGASAVEAHLTDPDGSAKLAFRLSDGSLIESVVMTDGKGERTLCLSSQVGCKMGCRFCRTAALGFSRNLTAGEIIEQLQWAETVTGPISRLVFMGMGEPTDNLAAVLQAVSVFTDPAAFGMSHRRITLSSCGVVPGIEALAAAKTGIRLAVSLNNAIESEREALMPVSRRYPLPVLKKSLRCFQAASGGKRITLEYVLLHRQNSSPLHAKALADFAKGLTVLINLIPLNAASELPFLPPTEAECRRFEAALQGLGVKVTRRRSKGRSVLGACGQLAGDLAGQPRPPKDLSSTFQKK